MLPGVLLAITYSSRCSIAIIGILVNTVPMNYYSHLFKKEYKYVENICLSVALFKPICIDYSLLVYVIFMHLFTVHYAIVVLNGNRHIQCSVKTRCFHYSFKQEISL